MALENIMDFMNAAAAEEKPAEIPFTVGVSHKLVFHKITAKNFRSVDNAGLTLDFEKNVNTLVVSEDNGAGKSTLSVWALYYALTGKPYNGKDNVTSLVNTANNKAMLVQLEFSVGGNRYRLERGRKPDVLAMYVGNESNQTWREIKFEAGKANIQDTIYEMMGFEAKTAQRIIENVILLGIDKFKPFIEMGAEERRSIVEPIWDLGVFTTMNEEAKGRLKVANIALEESEREIEKLKTDADYKERELASRKSDQGDYIMKLKHDYHVNVVPMVEESEDALVKAQSNLKELTAQPVDEAVEVAVSASDAVKRSKNDLKDNARHLYELQEVFNGNNIEAVAQLCGINYGEHVEHIDKLNSDIETEKLKISNFQTKLDELMDADTSELTASYTNDIKTIKDKLALFIDHMKAKYAEQYASTEAKLKAAQHDLNSMAEGEEQLENDVFDANKKLKCIYIDEVHEGIDKYSALIKESDAKRSQIEYALSIAEAEHENYSKMKAGDECPACGQTITQEHVNKHIDELADEIDNNRVLLNDHLAKHENLETELAKAKEYLDIYNETEQELKDAKAELETFRNEMNIASIECDKLEAELKNIEPERDEKIKAAQDVAHSRIQALEAKLANVDSMAGVEVQNVKDSIRDCEANIKKLESQIELDTNALQSNVKTAYENKVSRYESVCENAKESIKQSIDFVTKRVHESREAAEQAVKDAETKLNDMQERKAKALSSMKESNAQMLAKVEAAANALEEAQHTLEDAHADYETKAAHVKTIKDLLFLISDKEGKADIIREYLPFLNGKINEYLEALNMFIGFNMDEEFKVSMTAPDRSNQTLFSLSSGQRARVNLCIMLALRDVANLKASIQTNLLVLDEVLESLSSRGVPEAVTMLKNKFSSHNLFVISQRKAEFSEYFENLIVYALRNKSTVVLTND